MRAVCLSILFLGATAVAQDKPVYHKVGEKVVVGDIEVVVTGAVVRNIQFVDFTGKIITPDSKYYTIDLTVTNKSETRKASYLSPSVDVAGKANQELADQLGDKYDPVSAGFKSRPVNSVKADSIYPGKSIKDVLVFEVPIDKAEVLCLRIAGRSIEQTGDILWELPPRPVPAAKPMKKVPTAEELAAKQAAEKAAAVEANEKAAAGSLRAGKFLTGEARRKWLQKIVAKYPGTAAAKEAQAELDAK